MNCFNPAPSSLRWGQSALYSQTDKSFRSSVVLSHPFSSLSHTTVFNHLHRLFCLQWAQWLIVNFSATMTNTSHSAFSSFHEASLIYDKSKPSLRFRFFFSVYITTRETLSHFSLTDPLRACGYCWSVLIGTENSKSASSEQARIAPFIIMSIAVTFYHRNPEHNRVFCDFRVRNHF